MECRRNRAEQEEAELSFPSLHRSNQPWSSRRTSKAAFNPETKSRRRRPQLSLCCDEGMAVSGWPMRTSLSGWFCSAQPSPSVGFSAPTQSGIRADIGLSLSQFSFFGSILNIGAMIGAITSGRIADLISRKGAMRIAAVFCIMGWLAVLFAQDALMLYIGRFSSGYGIGIFSYVVPVFIAEIAPKNLRGCLTTLNQLFICAGVSAVYIVGTLVTWRQLTGMVPCILLLVGLFLIPESPRWLAKVGRQKEFQTALQKLRGKDADIAGEAAEIQVGVGLMVFQQIGGINGIGFYASQIFVSAGFTSGNLGTILLGCIQVPITVVGAFLMDRSGRRALLMVSATGTFLGTFITATSFYFKGKGMLMQWTPVLALCGILVYVAAFSIGMGAVPWVIMSEIFPINVKGTGGSLVTLVNWFGSWLVSYTFNFLMDWSAAGTFFIFSAASIATVLFVFRLVPETKGRTLEEIQEFVNHDR
ncbi:hypothetical protein HPP92_013212 [Vanilla planifolia]|uniref:Major facilitator superfamily (MFS) profile domain-containing protein n=1 Tax=Vanilla planifolia TaxID=51239 RepID=A0A835UYK6_VANPL|nr:hypothetical protein HPP92_013212 [Vanilla planifolia]